MVRRNISATPGGVKRRGPPPRLERTACLAAGFAVRRREGAADLALDHVGDLTRLLRLYASLLLFPACRLTAVAIDLAEQTKPEPDGADDGDENEQLGGAGKPEHPAI